MYAIRSYYAQLLTLYITPVYYMYLDNLRAFIGRLGGEKPAKGGGDMAN